MSDEQVQAAAAQAREAEAARERARANQAALAGSVGGVTVFQLLEQAQDLAHYYMPEQPELLWQFLASFGAFLLMGGFHQVVRRLEL